MIVKEVVIVVVVVVVLVVVVVVPVVVIVVVVVVVVVVVAAAAEVTLNRRTDIRESTKLTQRYRTNKIFFRCPARTRQTNMSMQAWATHRPVQQVPGCVVDSGQMAWRVTGTMVSAVISL
ncbi:hypothetical protein ElyMa_001539700 [Elysia marginata]|uniref:Uncharacterized protein n=1 Tax=Elysia marginata TaxID=1093978 RepID=A0AAV4J931_9GAST|nr:hypothetical protein ElyMa_001539700 [Elysia marginata]